MYDSFSVVRLSLCSFPKTLSFHERLLSHAVTAAFSGMIGKEFLELVLGEEVRRICENPNEGALKSILTVSAAFYPLCYLLIFLLIRLASVFAGVFRRCVLRSGPRQDAAERVHGEKSRETSEHVQSHAAAHLGLDGRHTHVRSHFTHRSHLLTLAPYFRRLCCTFLTDARVPFIAHFFPQRDSHHLQRPADPRRSQVPRQRAAVRGRLLVPPILLPSYRSTAHCGHSKEYDPLCRTDTDRV